MHKTNKISNNHLKTKCYNKIYHILHHKKQLQLWCSHTATSKKVYMWTVHSMKCRWKLYKVLHNHCSVDE